MPDQSPDLDPLYTLDYTNPVLYEALVSELAGREVTPGDAASTERLKAYWAEGEGAAKIGWGVAGDFKRCESLLGKYVGPTVVAGLCANLHKRATGGWPGHAPTEATVADTEHPAIHETASLEERATQGTGGKWRIQVISAGLGSSGYYSPAVLQEAASNGLIKSGTPLFFDHPSESERSDRPERSVRDIAAVFTGPATYNPTREALDGDIQVFAPYRELVKEMAPHIGLSISGSATDITEGLVDGKRVPIVEGLHAIASVDMVTKAGRGGKFVSLLESARAQMQDLETGPATIEAAEEGHMTDTTEVVPETPTSTTNQTTEAATAAAEGTTTGQAAESTSTTTPSPTQEAHMTDTTPGADSTAPVSETAPVTGQAPRNPREVMEAQIREQGHQIAVLTASSRARDIVTEVLASGWIGEAQRARLASALVAPESLPLTEAGELQEGVLRETAQAALDAAETEAAEILSAAGVGSPRGLGALTTPATEAAGKQYEDELRESFRKRGMSDAAIELAVKGR